MFLHPFFPPLSLPTPLLPCTSAVSDLLTLLLLSHHVPSFFFIYWIRKAVFGMHAFRVSLALLPRCALRDLQCPPPSWSSWPPTAPSQATSASQGSLSR